MSTIIKLRCIDQVLTFESTPVIASGGLEEDVLSVEFCSKWDGLAKTAVFWKTDDEAYHAPLDLNDSCVIPREVLADEGVFYFGIFGVSQDGRQRTTEAVRYTVAKGAITSGTKPSDPTPDIYAQLLARYAEVQSIAQQAATSASTSAKAAETSRKAAETAVAGVVSKKGDTMSGDLYVENNAPVLGLRNLQSGRLTTVSTSNGENNVRAYFNHRKDENNFVAIYLRTEEDDLATVFRLIRKVNGGETEGYDVIHTGNLALIKPSDIGAEPRITGAATSILDENLTPDRVLIADKDGKVTAAVAVTPAELAYLAGLTGNVQEQLTGKAPAADLNAHANNVENPHNVTAEQAGAVPTTRRVNGKELKDDISLKAVDVEALPNTGGTVTGDVILSKSGLAMLSVKSTSAGREVRNYIGSDGIAGLTNRKDASNGQGLFVYPETDTLTRALRLYRSNGGSAKYYNVLHEGNVSDCGVAKIETGSYIGTGTNGVMLTFSGKPKLVVVKACTGTRWHTFSDAVTDGYGDGRVFWVEGLTKEVGPGGNYGNYNREYTQEGNSLTWRIDTSAGSTSWEIGWLNSLGEKYSYLAVLG